MVQKLQDRHKSRVFFLLILGLTVILGIFMIVKLNYINISAEDVAKQQLPGLLSVAKFNDLFCSFRRRELLMTLSDKQSTGPYLIINYINPS